MVKKSYSSRIKVTKTGKLLKRPMAQSHFRSKKTSKQIHAKRKRTEVSKADQKRIKRYL